MSGRKLPIVAAWREHVWVVLAAVSVMRVVSVHARLLLVVALLRLVTVDDHALSAHVEIIV